MLTGVNSGKWYFEVTVLEADTLPNMPEPHTRIGWSRRDGMSTTVDSVILSAFRHLSHFACAGNLQGPCGYDSFSYSYRDVNGFAFHKSNGRCAVLK